MNGQLSLPFVRVDPPAAPPVAPPAGTRDRAGGFDIHFVPVRRARRYVLRVRPDGTLRVTIPRGGSRAEARKFAERHLEWAERERVRVLSRPCAPLAWNDGTSILIAGQPALISRERHATFDLVRAGGMTVRVPPGEPDVRPFLERALRQRAARELPPRVDALAAVHGLAVTRVTIRNQRSRWGSCSRRGAIALNFRLVQMPPDVCDYILIHELMHLRQANHSRRFWRLVESAFPAFRDAERWLKTTGRQLF